jgi:hypothetical protein
MAERPLHELAVNAADAVKTRKDYWSWLETSFLPSLLVIEDNNDKLFKEPMMLEVHS